MVQLDSTYNYFLLVSNINHTSISHCLAVIYMAPDFFFLSLILLFYPGVIFLKISSFLPWVRGKIIAKKKKMIITLCYDIWHRHKSITIINPCQGLTNPLNINSTTQLRRLFPSLYTSTSYPYPRVYCVDLSLIYFHR